jgi:hypothetical protein
MLDMNQQTRYKQIGNPLKKKIEWTVPRAQKLSEQCHDQEKDEP